MKKVRIGVNEVVVEIKPELEDLGNFTNWKIQLKKLEDNSTDWSVWFHEVLHAISDVYGAALSERQVRALENGLALFVRDNPQAFKSWLRIMEKAA